MDNRIQVSYNFYKYSQENLRMTGWATGICKLNGINIHYTRTGGNKPPLIFLHGLTGNGSCWSEVAQVLEEDYDIIMPDARGHGKSSAPGLGYRYEDHASDIEGLIEALQLSSPTLIGHSMGGMTAALVASRNPRLLRCLILADPTFLSPEGQREVREGDVIEQHRRYLNFTMDALMAEARMRHPGRSSDTIELIARARLQTSMGAFAVLNPPTPDYLKVVSAIVVPTLLVIGGPAGVVSPEVAADLQRVIPRLQVEQIPEAGHGLHYDQPGRFAFVVKAFVQ